MSSAYYWRDYPRTMPRRPGQYLVTFKLPFAEKEVDIDYWEDGRFGYCNSVVAWMPCPLPYRPYNTPSHVNPFQNEALPNKFAEKVMEERKDIISKADPSTMTQEEYYQ